MNVTSLLRDALQDLPARDERIAAALTARAADILRPTGALARLDAVAVHVGAWRGTDAPEVRAPVAVLFAADHGVAVHGVSAYPAAVTASMLDAFRAGSSTLHALAHVAGARVEVVDVGVGRPTDDLRTRAAMSPEGFAGAFSAGRDAVAAVATAPEGCDLLVVGEMGIANTTAAAAVCARLSGGDPTPWVGRGTGVDDARFAVKVAVVADACARTAHVDEPAEVLRELGGHELVAMAGAIVEARHRRIPVLLDGFVVGAAALALHHIAPDALDHCIAGHRSAEHAHAALLAHLGLEPLLDLGLRLGEGSGAMAAVPLVAMACRALVCVPTFAEWFAPR